MESPDEDRVAHEVAANDRILIVGDVAGHAYFPGRVLLLNSYLQFVIDWKHTTDEEAVD